VKFVVLITVKPDVPSATLNPAAGEAVVGTLTVPNETCFVPFAEVGTAKVIVIVLPFAILFVVSAETVAPVVSSAISA
jgi:hypothetical protein